MLTDKPKNSFESLNSYSVELWSLSALKTHKNHPRKVTGKQAEKSASLIRAASWIPPIIIDRNGFIIAGQEWADGAKILGMDEVQVIVTDTLSEAQIRLFRIAYVRIQEDGEWDRNDLAAELRYLMESELSCNLDFSVEFTGFETAEIDMFLNPEDKARNTHDPFDRPEPEIRAWVQGIIWRDEHFRGMALEQIAIREGVSATHIVKYIKKTFEVG